MPVRFTRTARQQAHTIRVPAACCGIVGLKTTFGLVSLKGVFPIEPKHLDTVGPMGKDVAHVVQGMDLLQKGFAARYARAVAAKPSAKQIKIGRLYLSGTDPQIDKAIHNALTQAQFQVVPLDQTFKSKWVPTNFAGNPALAIPVPLRHESFPVTSLQLVGPKFSEAELLNAGGLVEAAVSRNRQDGRSRSP